MNNHKGIFYKQEREKNITKEEHILNIQNYSELVRELEKLIEGTQMNNKVNYLLNSNSQKIILKSEGNNFKDIIPKENKLEKLLTLDNYQDIIIYK